MDSRNPLPDAARAATPRARRGWLFAIALWTGFLGAALMLSVALVLLPHEVLDAGWAGFSVGFLCSWVVMVVAIALALTLAAPLFEPRRGR